MSIPSSDVIGFILSALDVANFPDRHNMNSYSRAPSKCRAKCLGYVMLQHTAQKQETNWILLLRILFCVCVGKIIGNYLAFGLRRIRVSRIIFSSLFPQKEIYSYTQNKMFRFSEPEKINCEFKSEPSSIYVTFWIILDISSFSFEFRLITLGRTNYSKKYLLYICLSFN